MKQYYTCRQRRAYLINIKHSAKKVNHFVCLSLSLFFLSPSLMILERDRDRETEKGGGEKRGGGFKRNKSYNLLGKDDFRSDSAVWGFPGKIPS